MNSNIKNLIYAVSSIVIILPAILFTSDYYSYTDPMEKMVLWVSPEHDEIEEKFQEVSEKIDSTCFRTVTDGYFCYPKPLIPDMGLGISVLYSNTTKAWGEIHFDSVSDGEFMYTIKNIIPLNDETALFTFADKDYRVGSSTTTTYEITDDFEFSTVLEEFDTFIAKCDNYKGTSVTLIQYMGVKEIDGNEYFMNWHFNADVDNGIKCKYPEIIQHSLNYDFKKFGLPTDITMTMTRSPTGTTITFTEINVNADHEPIPILDRGAEICEVVDGDNPRFVCDTENINPRFSEVEFNGFEVSSNIDIYDISVTDNTQSIIITTSKNPDGFIYMDDPLPILQKLFPDKDIVSFAVISNDVEIPYTLEDGKITIDVHNAPTIFIIGFSKI